MNLSYTEHGLYRISTLQDIMYCHICSLSCDLHVTFSSGYSVPGCRHLLWRGLSAAHNCNEIQEDTTANGRTALCSMLTVELLAKEQSVLAPTPHKLWVSCSIFFLQYLGYLDLYQLSIHSPQRRKQVYSLNEAGEGQSQCQSVFFLGLIYFQHTPISFPPSIFHPPSFLSSLPHRPSSSMEWYQQRVYLPHLLSHHQTGRKDTPGRREGRIHLHSSLNQ